MNHYYTSIASEERQTAIRQLRLAHARHMQAADEAEVMGKDEEAMYWLWRASETHQKLLDLGEYAI
jgi:hypothetical protein